MITQQFEGSFVALGTFDGLHMGHKAVITAEKSQYERKIALMFIQHPQSKNGEAPCRLITPQQEREILFSWGVEPVYLDFTEISDMSPTEFVDTILVDKLNAKSIACGFNYRFGKGAEGDVNTLMTLCAEREIKLTVVDKIEYNDLCGHDINNKNGLTIISLKLGWGATGTINFYSDRKLKDQGKGVLLITHEIDVALKTADKIAIFYSGYVIEINKVENFLNSENLLHPYTKALVDALPKNGFKLTEGVQPLEEVPGCPYYENCPIRSDKCNQSKPELIEHDGAMIRCFNFDKFIPEEPVSEEVVEGELNDEGANDGA